jgi:RNA polymerase sigma factor (sigma-70 family)
MTTSTTDLPTSDPKPEYQIRNQELFKRRGAIQWDLHLIRRRLPASLSPAEKRQLRKLLDAADVMVAAGVGQLPEREVERLERLTPVVEAGYVADADEQARSDAYYAFRRVSRIRAVAGAAGEPEEGAWVALNQKLDVLQIRDVKAEGSVIERRALRVKERELDQVTEEITDVNYGLIRSYTMKFTRSAPKHDAQDYETAARVGFFRALSTYDPSEGRFDTWAYKPIQREVLSSVRSTEFAAMRPGDFERRPQVMRAMVELQRQDASATPTPEQIAVQAGLTVEQVNRVLRSPRIESLSARVSTGGSDEGSEIGDMIEDVSTQVEGTVSVALTLQTLETYGLSVLSPRELLVLVRRFGLDDEPEEKLAAIGSMLCLSREAVRNVEAKALAKIRHPTVLRRIYREGRP